MTIIITIIVIIIIIIISIIIRRRHRCPLLLFEHIAVYVSGRDQCRVFAATGAQPDQSRISVPCAAAAAVSAAVVAVTAAACAQAAPAIIALFSIAW